MPSRPICYFHGRIVSPTHRIDPGRLLKFRQALTRVTRVLDDIVAVRGRYEPGRYGPRLAFALALSLLIHAFVLSLRFGIAGFGLPGVALPWAERRAFSSDLSVRIAQAPRAPTPAAAPAKTETRRRSAAVEPMVAKPTPPRTFVARTPAKPKRAKRRPPHTKAPPVARAAPRPVPAKSPPRPPARKPSAQPEFIAQAEPQQETFSVPPSMPDAPERTPAVAAKPVEPAPVVNKPAAPARSQIEVDQEADQRAREEEAARLEQARLQEEAIRQEESRLEEEARQREQAGAAREALELEALRQAEEAARQEAAALERQRALELEAKRQQEETAREQAAALERQRTLELEAKRQAEAKLQEEAARQQTAAIERQRALELEAKRQDDARAKLALELEALRQAEEAARQAAALARERELETKRQAGELAARERAAALAAAEPGRSAVGTIGPAAISGSDLAAKALSQLRTPGALRAEPQSPHPSSQVPPLPRSAGAENPRRRQAPGGVERDIGLRMYVESWRWKIERNGNLNYPSGARTRAAENPVVSVAVRRDGSVEEVIIHRSSGQRDLDQAVRRIVQLNAPYSVFPPDLARAYDVIEIRRVWVFGSTLRIVEELN